MPADRVADEVRAALAAAESEDASPAERAEMLMEIAMGFQQRPRNADQLHAAVALYGEALSICPESERLLRPRIMARKGTALQATPADQSFLDRALAAYEEAKPVLAESGMPEEIAEVEMNIGVVVQSLAGAGRARITDAVATYQRALRTFDRSRFPREFAHTIADRANCLRNLPDDPEHPDRGNRANLGQARACHAEAREIFATHGEADKAHMVAGVLIEIERELLALTDAPRLAMQ